MEPTLVFIDDARQTLFYLAFDLLRADAPIRAGVAYIEEASVVGSVLRDPAADARHAAVQAALLGDTASPLAMPAAWPLEWGLYAAC